MPAPAPQLLRREMGLRRSGGVPLSPLRRAATCLLLVRRSYDNRLAVRSNPGLGHLKTVSVLVCGATGVGGRRSYHTAPRPPLPLQVWGSGGRYLGAG